MKKWKELGNFNPMWHMLGPVMSLPKAISPEHEVDQAQPHGLKEAGVS